MATTLQIKYYNTYILKKINQTWNSSTGTMDRTNAQYDWYVEESRIKGDFNGKFSGIAPRACLLYTSPSPRDLSTSRMPSSA